jgi:hypothetical protein
MTIPVQYDVVENAEYRFISTGPVKGVRFVATLGDSEDNSAYLDETFGAYESE